MTVSVTLNQADEVYAYLLASGLVNVIGTNLTPKECNVPDFSGLNEALYPVQEKLEQLYFKAADGIADIEPLEGLSILSTLEHYQSRVGEPDPYTAYDGFNTYCTGQFTFYLADNLQELATIKFRLIHQEGNDGIVIQSKVITPQQRMSELQRCEMI